MKAQISLRNEKFIPIIRNQTSYYGGSQAWWEKYDSRVSSFGCGIIAMCNTELYLNQQNKEAEISDEEYIDYVNRRKQEDYALFKGRLLSWLGLLPHKMKRGIKKYYQSKGMKIRSVWAPTLRKYKLLEFICEMLEKNLPVTASYFAFKKIFFYQYDEKENNMKQVNSCKAHYFNITGLIEWQEISYFVVSSWGKEYYIKVEDWMRHRSCFSNILYIREIA